MRVWGSSNIDVTLLTPQIRSQIGGWFVHDNTDSDHNTITFVLSLRGGSTRSPTAYRFNTSRADWEKFARSLSRTKLAIEGSTLESQARTIVEAIQAAAAESIPQKRRGNSKIGKQPWWNDELSSLRNVLARKRRLGLNHADRLAYNRL